MAALAPPPLTIVAILDQDGRVQHPFSPTTLPSSLLEAAHPDDHSAFAQALKTNQLVILNLRFPSVHSSNFLVAITPSRVTESRYFCATPCPQEAGEEKAFDPGRLHDLKGELANWELFNSHGSMRDLHADTTSRIDEMCRAISPFSPPPTSILLGLRSETLVGILNRLTKTCQAECTKKEKTFIPFQLPFLEPLLLDSERSSALYTILDNLLSNAVKYSEPAGSISITVESCASGASDTTTYLHFTVINSGTPLNIDPDTKTKVFAHGNRLDKEGGEIEGQGVGLSHSIELATRFGWLLDYAPCKNPLGTAFVLDANFPSSKSVKLPLYPITPSEKTRSEVRVVVMEDNPITSLTITRMFNRCGITHVTGYATIEDALKACLKEDVDLIIADNYVPDRSGKTRSGLEAIRARRLFETERRLKHIPCLLSSADEVLPNVFQPEGATAFHHKPLTIREIHKICELYFPKTQGPKEAAS